MKKQVVGPNKSFLICKQALKKKTEIEKISKERKSKGKNNSILNEVGSKEKTKDISKEKVSKMNIRPQNHQIFNNNINHINLNDYNSYEENRFEKRKDLNNIYTSIFQKFKERRKSFKKSKASKERNSKDNSGSIKKKDTIINAKNNIESKISEIKIEVAELRNKKVIKNYKSQVLNNCETVRHQPAKKDPSEEKIKSNQKDLKRVIPRQKSTINSNMKKFLEKHYLNKPSNEKNISERDKTGKKKQLSIDKLREQYKSLNFKSISNVNIHKKTYTRKQISGVRIRSLDNNNRKSISSIVFQNYKPKHNAILNEFKKIEDSTKLKIKEIYRKKSINLSKNLLNKAKSNNFDKFGNNQNRKSSIVKKKTENNSDIDQVLKKNYNSHHIEDVKMSNEFIQIISNENSLDCTETPNLITETEIKEEEENEEDIYQIVKKIDFNSVNIHDNNIFRSERNVGYKVNNLLDLLFTSPHEKCKNISETKTVSTIDTSNKKKTEITFLSRNDKDSIKLKLFN